MAEALVNHDLAGKVRAFSAGTNPQSQVATNAITALQLASVATNGLVPKLVDKFLDRDFDLVITVCDHAKEVCPIFPRSIRTIHLPFHDPHGEPLESFIAVRDAIRTQLVPLVVKLLGISAVT